MKEEELLRERVSNRLDQVFSTYLEVFGETLPLSELSRIISEKIKERKEEYFKAVLSPREFSNGDLLLAKKLISDKIREPGNIPDVIVADNLTPKKKKQNG